MFYVNRENMNAMNTIKNISIFKYPNDIHNNMQTIKNISIFEHRN